MTNLKKRTPISTEAVWFDIIDADGIEFGSIKSKHQNLNSPAWSLKLTRAIDQLTPVEQNRFDNPKCDEDILFRRRMLLSLLVMNYVVDSKLLNDDGTTAPHSEATVLSFLINPDNWDLAQAFDKNVANAKNFKVEQAASEAKKN